ncbi:MAG: hypothetical protein NT018_12230 [Armatimonadetes bacterium]|nr:hypothetical protein [Armatimonadota bacterium]
MGENKRKMLCVLVAFLFAAVMFLQTILDPKQMKMQKASTSVSGGQESQEFMVQLPAQFLLASFTGFKEVIAGVLWVRADSFFHTGQYEAIIPLVRLVTWLDPHNIDVYTTGAWHLDYNFVDTSEMSDKRYIPVSIAILKEGIANNPRIWDLYFELGWTHYNKKLLDYDKGLKYIEQAVKRPGFDINTGKETPRPEYVDRMLAHQYEKVGRFEDAIKQWRIARARSVAIAKGEKNPEFVSSETDICDRNLSLLYLRLAWRYGNMDYYKKGVDIMQRLAAMKGAPAEIVKAAKNAGKDYAKRLAANNPPKDAAKPVDAGLTVEMLRVKPGVFMINGKINLMKAEEYKGLASECVTNWYADNLKLPALRKADWRDGARANWMLCDYDYKMDENAAFNVHIDKDKMIVWDSIYVGGGKFKSGLIDLSKREDRGFYPFKADKYKLVVWISPQQPGCADYIQDRIGWKGEALTDKNYLDTKTHPGFKELRWEKILSRKDIL